MALVQSNSKSDGDSAGNTSPEQPTKSLDDFISSLRAREGWAVPLVQYKKYWFNQVMLKKILLAEQAFVPRSDDIILATQPKCGTTWLKALVFAIANRSLYSFTDHPLLTRHAQDLVPFIEIPGASSGTDHRSDIESLPSPRILGTHIPLSLLPPDTSTRGCRVVYLCRDPKDTLVSRLHFENTFTEAFNLSMDNAFTMFCEGFSPYGPFWDHCLEYWEASAARPDHVLFLKYEEIKADPAQVVRKLATFLGVPLTQEEERSGVAQQVARLCSFESLTSLQANKVGVTHNIGNGVYVRSSSFYRKGKVGDWVNHMSPEMGAKIDGIVQEKLKGSGLIF